jgi:ElaB/YqjD/DUF883 family membrane-anchored ribosome-binding protein
MSIASSFNETAQDAQSQIAALRKQVNELMSERVSPALSQAADRAQYMTQQATGYTKQGAETMAEQVRGRPLMAVALAGAIGYVLGRFIR